MTKRWIRCAPLFVCCLVALAPLLWALPAAAAQSEWLQHQPVISLAGHVTDSAGKPVPGAVLSYTELTGQNDFGNATGNVDGAYSIPLHAGTYKVTAAAAGFQPSSQFITLAGGQAPTADFPLTRAPATGSVSGKVIDSSTRAAVAHVDVMVISGGDLMAPVVYTAEDGSYTITDLPTGFYDLYVADADPAPGATEYLTDRRLVAIRADRPATQDFALDPAGYLDVKILTPAGAPAADSGLRITLELDGKPYSAFQQIADGGAEKIALGAETYTIVAGGPAYQDSPAQKVTVKAGQTTPVTLVVGDQTTGSVTGKVTDTTGAPVPFARVAVITGTSPYHYVLTGPDGQYRIEHVAAGTRTVHTWVPGYRSDSADPQVTVTAGAVSQVDLTLRRTVLASVRIVDAAGKPVEGAYLVQGSERYYATPTGAGNYLVQVAGPTLTVAAEAPGYNRTETKTISPGSTDSTFTLEKATHGAIQGRAIDRTANKPLAGLKVTAQQVGSQAGPVVEAVTAADGSFRLAGLLPSTYQVMGQGNNFETSVPTVTVTAGSTANLDLSLFETGTLEAHAVDAQGKPVRGSAISVALPNGVTGGVMPTNLADGAASMGLRVGQYTVTAKGPGLVSQPQAVAIKFGERVTITLPMAPTQNGSVTGKAVFEGTGTPAQGIGVELVHPISRARIAGPVTTDENGAFTFTDVAPGAYLASVVATTDDRGVGISLVNLQSGGTAKTSVTVRHTPQLTDMADHWANADVRKLQGLGILSGYPDGTFHPEATLTRYEVAKTVAIVLKKTPSQAPLAFLKVLPDGDTIPEWARPYVAIAVTDGWMKLDAGGFHGDRPVTRAEMAEIIGHLLPQSVDSAALPFSDVGGISDKSREYVARTVRAGIITGFPDGTFRPDDLLTRAQMARMLVRLIEAK